MIDVSECFKLHSSTLHLAVQLLDAYLDIEK